MINVESIRIVAALLSMIIEVGNFLIVVFLLWLIIDCLKGSKK